MEKKNCWEFMKCGREPGGARTDLGICAAAVEHRLNRIHEGWNAGRACWIVAGTLCGGQEQGTFAQKYHNCEKCDFYKTVKAEERHQFTLSPMLLKRLNESGPPVSNMKSATTRK